MLGRRHEHRHIGLAAGARESAAEVRDLAVRAFDTDDEHVLGEPAFLLPSSLAMRSAKHFLASNALPP